MRLICWFSSFHSQSQPNPTLHNCSKNTLQRLKLKRKKGTWTKISLKKNIAIKKSNTAKEARVNALHALFMPNK